MSNATAVVTPVYRNAATLEELIGRVAAVLAPTDRILAVDDASPDDGRFVLERLVAREPRLAVVGHGVNRGQQCAVRTGMRWAQGDRVVVLDADLQDPPEAIPALLRALEEVELVFAGRRGRYQGLGRMATSAAFRTVRSWATGLPRDAGLYFALRRGVRDRLTNLGDPDGSLLPLLGWSARSITSIPVGRARRLHGKSAYGEGMRWRAAWATVQWSWLLRRGRVAALGEPHSAPPAYRLGWVEEGQEP